MAGTDKVGPGGGYPYFVSGCQDALDTLYHYLDGELTEERRHQIQHHLDDCAPCLQAFDFEAELKAVVARRCRETVPETLRLRIAVAIREASVAGEPSTRPVESE